jgi:hypothetical protein
MQFLKDLAFLDKLMKILMDYFLVASGFSVALTSLLVLAGATVFFSSFLAGTVVFVGLATSALGASAAKATQAKRPVISAVINFILFYFPLYKK